MSIAHNLSISSNFVQEQERYMHSMTVIISDVDDETQTIQKSEQFNVSVAPAMEPLILVQALRAFADSIEEYVTEKPEASR